MVYGCKKRVAINQYTNTIEDHVSTILRITLGAENKDYAKKNTSRVPTLDIGGFLRAAELVDHTQYTDRSVLLIQHGGFLILGYL